MPLLRPTLLLFLALLVGSLSTGTVAAATCRAVQGGSWGPIGVGTAVWSCDGPSSSEDLDVVPGGVEVEITADLTQAATPTAGIRVESAGSLSASVTPTTGRLRITLGGAGLVCASGSSCKFRGAYRPFAASGPAVVDSVSQSSMFAIQGSLPCPGMASVTCSPNLVHPL